LTYCDREALHDARALADEIDGTELPEPQRPNLRIVDPD
jgi:hypothetical protein